MWRHECIPPQQISPSAANLSPYSSAMSQAALNVSAIFDWLPSGSLTQSAGPVALSIRTTPWGRTPIWRSLLAISQPLRTWVRNA
jgi:hypothetical protein